MTECLRKGFNKFTYKLTPQNELCDVVQNYDFKNLKKPSKNEEKMFIIKKLSKKVLVVILPPKDEKVILTFVNNLVRNFAKKDCKIITKHCSDFTLYN